MIIRKLLILRSPGAHAKLSQDGTGRLIESWLISLLSTFLSVAYSDVLMAVDLHLQAASYCANHPVLV